MSVSQLASSAGAPYGAARYTHSSARCAMAWLMLPRRGAGCTHVALACVQDVPYVVRPSKIRAQAPGYCCGMHACAYACMHGEGTLVTCSGTLNAVLQPGTAVCCCCLRSSVQKPIVFEPARLHCAVQRASVVVPAPLRSWLSTHAAFSKGAHERQRVYMVATCKGRMGPAHGPGWVVLRWLAPHLQRRRRLKLNLGRPASSCTTFTFCVLCQLRTCRMQTADVQEGRFNHTTTLPACLPVATASSRLDTHICTYACCTSRR